MITLSFFELIPDATAWPSEWPVTTALSTAYFDFASLKALWLCLYLLLSLKPIPKGFLAPNKPEPNTPNPNLTSVIQSDALCVPLTLNNIFFVFYYNMFDDYDYISLYLNHNHVFQH